MNGVMRANIFSYSEAFFDESFSGSRTWSGRLWHSDNWDFGGDFSECFRGPVGSPQQLIGSTVGKRSFCWRGEI